MTVTEFLKRRLIRLHPMVVIGAVIGAVMFYFQGCSVWDVTKVTVPMLLAATLMNACLIPASPGTEIRGLGEMYPLNGPSWSLFSSTPEISCTPSSSANFRPGHFPSWFSWPGAGWRHSPSGAAGRHLRRVRHDGRNMVGGSLRLMFAFSAGLLLSRVFKPVHIRGAFWICGLCVVALLSVPRIGGNENLWMNGLYDTFCAVVAFPLLVFLGASGKTTDKVTARVCKFLGDISYPLYMVHYPFIYLYYAWVKNGDLTFRESLPGALALFFGSVILAWLCLRLYDEPVRKFLSKHLLRKG